MTNKKKVKANVRAGKKSSHVDDDNDDLPSKPQRRQQKDDNNHKHRRGKGRYTHWNKHFDQQLQKLGLRVQEVAGDGNCMFRSIMDQMEGPMGDHIRCRRLVMDYIESHKDDFAPFVEDDEPFEKYVARLRRDAAWGGNLELQAASLVFQVNINIHQDENPVWEIRNFPPGKARVIHLSYHDGDHYNSVRPLDDACDGPAVHKGLAAVPAVGAAPAKKKKKQAGAKGSKGTAESGEYEEAEQEEEEGHSPDKDGDRGAPAGNGSDVGAIPHDGQEDQAGSSGCDREGNGAGRQPETGKAMAILATRLSAAAVVASRETDDDTQAELARALERCQIDGACTGGGTSQRSEGCALWQGSSPDGAESTPARERSRAPVSEAESGEKPQGDSGLMGEGGACGNGCSRGSEDTASEVATGNVTGSRDCGAEEVPMLASGATQQQQGVDRLEPANRSGMAGKGAKVLGMGNDVAAYTNGHADGSSSDDEETGLAASLASQSFMDSASGLQPGVSAGGEVPNGDLARGNENGGASAHHTSTKNTRAAAAKGTSAHQKKVPRNRACPCGSSKKYKNCCGTASAIAGRLEASRPLNRKQKKKLGVSSPSVAPPSKRSDSEDSENEDPAYILI